MNISSRLFILNLNTFCNTKLALLCTNSSFEIYQCDITILRFFYHSFSNMKSTFLFSILQTNTKMDIVPCQLSNISLVSNKAFFFLYTSFKHLHLIMLHWILIATNRFTNTHSRMQEDLNTFILIIAEKSFNTALKM